jgi:hypothetical protein
MIKCGRWAGHVARWGREEVYTGFFWWGNPRERDHLKNPGVRWEDIKKDIHEVGWDACTGLMWLRTGRGGGHV